MKAMSTPQTKWRISRTTEEPYRVMESREDKHTLSWLDNTGKTTLFNGSLAADRPATPHECADAYLRMLSPEQRARTRWIAAPPALILEVDTVEVVTGNDRWWHRDVIVESYSFDEAIDGMFTKLERALAQPVTQGIVIEMPKVAVSFRRAALLAALDIVDDVSWTEDRLLVAVQEQAAARQRLRAESKELHKVIDEQAARTTELKGYLQLIRLAVTDHNSNEFAPALRVEMVQLVLSAADF